MRETAGDAPAPEDAPRDVPGDAPRDAPRDTPRDTPATDPDTERVAALLDLLGPPDPRYGLVAERAAHLVAADGPLRDGPTVERAIATYFELFAQGYVVWQESYDYERIHEYFFGAYLRALRAGGAGLDDPAGAALYHLTRAMLCYTQCENDTICDDPEAVVRDAGAAAAHAAAAGAALDRARAPARLVAPLRRYVDAHARYFTGLSCAAELHRYADRRRPPPERVRETVEACLAAIEGETHELYTELSSHYRIAERKLRAAPLLFGDLVVAGATLTLSAVADVAPEAVDHLFATYAAADVLPVRDLDALKRRLRLPPLSAARRSRLMDLFETGFGKESLEELVFELNDGAVSVELNADGERKTYVFDDVQVRFARLGTMSVELTIGIRDAPVSHVRVLQSLLAPHSGRFDVVWDNAPPGAGRGRVDYVLPYLPFVSEPGAGGPPPPGAGGPPAPGPPAAGVPSGADLAAWEDSLRDIADHLHAQMLPRRGDGGRPESAPPAPPAPPSPDAARATAYECLRRALAAAGPGGPGAPGGRDRARLPRLVDVVHHVRDCFESLLEREAGDPAGPTGMAAGAAGTGPPRSGAGAAFITFDPNTSWFGTVCCDDLRSRALGAVGDDPPPPPGGAPDREGDRAPPGARPAIQKHPELKGLIMPSREARASFDDWLFAEPPERENLALIRSHDGDLLYVNDNGAFLCFPDDPSWIVQQYLETLRMVYNVRVRVASFNRRAAAYVDELRAFMSERRLGAGARASEAIWGLSRELHERRREVEDFRATVRQELDLVRSSTISQQQDHGVLWRAMMACVHIDETIESLNRKIVNLDDINEWFGNRLGQLIDEMGHRDQQAREARDAAAAAQRQEEERRWREREEREKRYEARVNALLLVLTMLFGVQAIAALPGPVSGAVNVWFGTDKGAAELSADVVVVMVWLVSSAVLLLASVRFGFEVWTARSTEGRGEAAPPGGGGTTDGA
jgi:hypothetical protein